MSNEKFMFYKEYPKTCKPDDFWGQVKRTVNGKPISEEQIKMIVQAVTTGLKLQTEDILLDLCCGNGALSFLLFESCKGGTGVDFSEYLISIARNNFVKSSHHNCISYILQDVVDFCQNPIMPQKYTKALCYGSFAYLEYNKAEKMLLYLKNNFPNLKRVFIGNCPDKEKMDSFFSDKTYVPGIESVPDSPIGIWRTQKEFVSLAESCGWQIIIKKMPSNYYASHYRYDVLLKNE
ncbi:class I SAM-dependent methyltransferase [Legionella israelensis]|uniref:Methyltransferase domain protein n=1 Tax=Legionella israelensis TaxID=454 RepID=A0A0W0WNU9_9GAMM|nr:class I SAM-dependent methyltransferase [Legionella israelensis]KTD33987.1 Methyltransferase domain protein [Legionella israelensis]QBS10678.1 class I SAM-dependent methyltransferase [Legionella israelensis]SCX83925.1 Methyltransferase domain-containing protein [Legionella israelensis DSM 19235]STX57633.1 Predicted O-methyltransferase [Legionella israelensis]